MSEFQLTEFLRLLDANDVAYIIVGGVASRIQGAATTTQDLDILPDPSPENLDRLARALSSPNTEKKEPSQTTYGSHPVIDPMEFRTADISSYRTANGVVDILMEMLGVGGFDVVIRNARRYEWEGLTLLVAGLDDIIASKEAAGRAKDRRALDALYAARDLLRDLGDAYEVTDQQLDVDRDPDTPPDQ